MYAEQRMRQEESIALLMRYIATLEHENIALQTAIAIALKQEQAAQIAAANQKIRQREREKSSMSEISTARATNEELHRQEAQLLQAQQALLQAEQQRVAELKERNHLLENRDRILEATAVAANALLTIDNFDIAVNTALKVIGESLDCDRMAVIENFHTPTATLPSWRLLYEWDSPHTVSQISYPDIAQGTYKGIEEWYERLNQGQSISYLLEEMPEPFRSGQAIVGVKALHVVPIFVEGQCWGALGFDDCREGKRRGSAELALLKTVAACIGSAIQRQRIQQAEQERATELAKANASLQQRDRLLSVVAQVTKNLLETEDIDIAIPAALQAIGEVANISRVQLILERQDPATQKLQHQVTYEWVAEGITPQINHPTMAVIDNDDVEVLLRELCAGRSIWRIVDHLPDPIREQFASIGIKSSGGVPLFIEGHYIGCVAFDDCVTLRHWSQQEIDVLTAAAEGIGAALHRKQLVERLIAERAKAAEERVTELSKANTALKNSIDHLTADSELDTFLCHVILEIKHQLDAQRAHLFLYDPPSHTLRLHLGSEANVVLPKEKLQDIDAFLEPIPADITRAWEIMVQTKQPVEFGIWENPHPEHWPEALKWHRSQGHQTAMCIPLMLGDQALGFLGLAFQQKATLNREEFELAQALAHQATLAIQLTRLAEAAKQAAVAREQEKATQEHAAEVAKANEVMQRVLNRLCAEPQIEAFLGYLLAEVATQMQSDTAMITPYDADTDTLHIAAIVENGEPMQVGLIQSSLPTIPAPFLERLMMGESYCIFDLESDAEVFCPVAATYLRSLGKRQVIAFPIRLGERFFGQISLAYENLPSISHEQTALIQALSTQAALAIQLTCLANQAQQVALAHEREQAAQVRVAQLAKANTVLKRTLDVLATEPQLDRSLGHVLQVMTEQLESTSAALWLYNPATDKFSLHLVYDNGKIIAATPETVEQLVGEWTAGRKLPRDLSLRTHIRDRRPVVYQVDTSPDLTNAGRRFMARLGVQTLLGVPLLLGSATIGSFTVRFTQKRDFQAEELELTQALAHQATLAIQLLSMAEAAKQAAILKEQEKAAKEQIAELVRANESLRGCVNRLADEPDLETFWEHILLEASAQVNSYAAALFLYNKSSHTRLMKRYVRQGRVVPIHTDPELELFRIPVAGSIVSLWKQALFRGEAVLFNLDDCDEQVVSRINWHRRQGHRAIVRVPLILGSRPLGFIGLCFREPRTSLPQNIELIMALAQQATLAIHLTHLAEQSRQAAILEERNRMAREIHDTLAQAFTGVIVQLGAASRIVPSKLADVQVHITQARDLAREGLAEARRSVNALRPQILETGNLCQAFKHLAAQMSAAIDTQIICNTIGEVYPLAVDVENNLLRIGQEALTNSIKHADASEIKIELMYEPQQFILRVKDNGQGFETDSFSTVKGFGLMGMKERSDRIGAQMTIQSVTGQGTEITILINR